MLRIMTATLLATFHSVEQTYVLLSHTRYPEQWQWLQPLHMLLKKKNKLHLSNLYVSDVTIIVVFGELKNLVALVNTTSIH